MYSIHTVHVAKVYVGEQPVPDNSHFTRSNSTPEMVEDIGQASGLLLLVANHRHTQSKLNASRLRVFQVVWRPGRI